MSSNGKNIIWLASYPKSGNTWFRIFLTNLLQKHTSPANINELTGGPIASSRQLFDELTGIDSSDLTFDEIEKLRPLVYRLLSEKNSVKTFYKIHDAYTYIHNEQPIIPVNISYGAIYFIRNPLDVAISFAHHANKKVSEIISLMNDPDYKFCNKNDKLHPQLMQRLLSWSGHIFSWTTQSDFPVLVIRYEDLLSDPFSEFKRAVLFSGLIFSDEEIKRAIKFSDFEEVSRQEEMNGFDERPSKSVKFFRCGRSGQWKQQLTAEEKKRIESGNREAMKRYGYLS